MADAGAVNLPKEPAAQSAGIGGHLLHDPRRTRENAELISRAVRQGWKMSKADFEELPAIVSEIARTSNSEMAKLCAVRTLISMHGQNLGLERAAAPRPGTQVNIFAGQLPPAALTALATADRAIAQLPAPVDPSPGDPAP